MALAVAKYRSTVLRQDIEPMLKAIRGGDDALALLTRATVAPGNTATSGWAAQLAHTAFGDYLGSLAGSAASQIMALGMTVPFIAANQYIAPTRNTAPATLPWVGESAPIPVRAFDFQGLLLKPKKMGAISVISRELAKRAGGQSAVRQMLHEDAELALDSAYFSDAAEDNVTHAGLLNGVTPIDGYAGGDLSAFQEDVGAILAVIGPRNSGRIVYVTGHYAAERISLKFPDFKGAVIGSPAVADATLIGIDAGSLVHSFGDFDVDASTDAVVHMNDDPLEIVADNGAVADPTRSVFQTDCVALRILGDVAFGARKPNAVAVVEGVTW
ncbi:hypothetical protein ASD80_10035 [Devosia sp. Root635]|nr:hypothetical protein ASD80_10035 [Devosia sp. Root635]